MNSANPDLLRVLVIVSEAIAISFRGEVLTVGANVVRSGALDNRKIEIKVINAQKYGDWPERHPLRRQPYRVARMFLGL